MRIASVSSVGIWASRSSSEVLSISSTRSSWRCACFLKTNSVLNSSIRRLWSTVRKAFSSSARRICSRSADSNVESWLGVFSGISAALNSDRGTRSTGPRERMTALSIRFSSSRTLPGHGQRSRAFMVSGGMDSIRLFILRACFWTKWWTRRGTSSGRSRSGGTCIGNTLKR